VLDAGGEIARVHDAVVLHGVEELEPEALLDVLLEERHRRRPQRRPRLVEESEEHKDDDDHHHAEGCEEHRCLAARAAHAAGEVSGA